MPTAPRRPAIRRTLGFLAATAGAVAVLGGCSTDVTAHPPDADVPEPLSCEIAADGALRATGDVTNHSSKASFYLIEVAFTDEGTVLEQRMVTVDSVEPGSTVGFEAVLPDAPRGADCRLDGVDRLAA